VNRRLKRFFVSGTQIEPRVGKDGGLKKQESSPIKWR
jgi:hypothetical protein